MADDETPSAAALTMDRGLSLGNSQDTFGRRSLHVKIGNSTAEPLPVSVTGTAAANQATIANLAVPLANTEVSYAFPAKTSKFSIRSRSPSRIQFAFISGNSGTTFFTILPGLVWAEDNIDITGVTLYLQTNLASQTVEIMSWQHP